MAGVTAGTGTGTRCKHKRNVPSASSLSAGTEQGLRAWFSVPAAEQPRCSWLSAPVRCARAPTPTQRPGDVLAGQHRRAHRCGRGFRPTAATATSARSRTQAGNKDAELGKAAGEVAGKRHPGGEGTERSRRHRGADLVPQVGKVPGGWQGKPAPAEPAAAAGKINKWERAESWAESEGER